MIKKEEEFVDASKTIKQENGDYSSSLKTKSSIDENNNSNPPSFDNEQKISRNLSRNRYQTTIESSSSKASLSVEQKILLDSRDRSQTTIDSSTVPQARERRQTMPARLVNKDEDNQLSSALSQLFPSSSSILIEKENDGYYALDGRQVHTWESLVNSIQVSYSENDEFQLRDSFQKAVHLIGAGNMFEAISTMETVRLEQLWLDRLVNT